MKYRVTIVMERDIEEPSFSAANKRTDRIVGMLLDDGWNVKEGESGCDTLGRNEPQPQPDPSPVVMRATPIKPKG